MLLLPDSVSGLNWSAPKARLHGLMPPAPMIRRLNPTPKKANCPGVGPTHVLLSFVAQCGGCNLEIVAVNVSAISPLEEKGNKRY